MFPAVPGIPSNVRITDATTDSISLAWDAPESDGGATIKQYVIVIREVTRKKYRKAAKVDGNALSCTVSAGIEENQEYFIKVYAENEARL